MRSPESAAALAVREAVQKEMLRAQDEAALAFASFRERRERALALERAFIATGVVINRIESDDKCDCRAGQ